MIMNPKQLINARKSNSSMSVKAALLFSVALFTVPAVAQQAGGVNGTVTQADGSALSGVKIEARGPNLPGVRTTTSGTSGNYRLPLLPPGSYEVTFTFEDGSTQKRAINVALQQNTDVDVAYDSSVDEIVVTGTASYLDSGIGTLINSIGADVIDGVPVGQEYRDLQKLIPGVQYSELSVRGPSAGGSGQDNNYQFDGVDVSLPMFGTLSAEPSSHDIAHVSVIRGGATAVGFNRSGGFLINTSSRSGTNEFHGEVKYQFQTAGMTGEQKTGDSPVEYDEDRRWLTASLGGPILEDKLFFYTSYYRPTKSRSNESNAYGEVPNYSSTRDEFFGKLTFAPTDNILLDASYRRSDKTVSYRSIGAYESPTASLGDSTSLDIAIIEGSWIIDDNSSFNVKYTNFKDQGSSGPDTLFDFPIAVGDSLNIGSLDQQGYLNIPTLTGTDPVFDAFATPYITEYGYGDPSGGGAVGGAPQIDDVTFKREVFEASYDRQFYFGDVSHDFHIGYQHQMIQEDLARLSNGWGSISLLGGTGFYDDGTTPTPAFFRARVNEMSLSGTGVSPNINSAAKMQSFEINDKIETGDLTFNVGLLISNDTLYGQGLENDDSALSGFVESPGTRYKMYESSWGDMIQPRFGVTWDYSDTSKVYANYARYHPSASSLARAASWARNTRSTMLVYFDETGDYIDHEGVSSSSGKMFVEDMDPRKVDEFLVGWESQATSELTLRAHARHRKGGNFWEDTWNGSRVWYDTPEGIPKDLYIENLSDMTGQIGSGSSYVIAQLDTAYTKYWEVSAEAEYTTDKLYVNASYTWSRYTGNFDQDSTTTNNDQNVFIGSSNLADGRGRQLWDNKDGILSGDRTHVFKVYGYYKLDWNAQVGAYVAAQSGQPWETWDATVYGYSSTSSETIRYAEPAGSRRTDAHVQVDLNYTQNFEIFEGHNIQLRADLFNVFNSQTGYAINPKVHSAGFMDPTRFYKPRRLQLAVKYAF